MDSTSAQSLIINAISDFGAAALVVLAAVLAIGVGLLVFYFGWTKIRQSTVIHYAGGKWRGKTWLGKSVNEDYRR